MILDTTTLAAASALVVVTTAVIFIAETLLRRDTGAGRVWALAYLTAVLTACCYLVWLTSPQMWWAIAFGNAAHVGGIGLMWLGCRRFNRASMLVPSLVLVVLAALVATAALVEHRGSGDWVGSLPMLVALALVGGAGAFEATRGEMKRHRNALVLAVALGLICVYNAARAIVVVIDGSDGQVFLEWLGPRTTSILTMILMIVSVVAVSVLRAGRAQLPGVPVTRTLAIDGEGILVTDAFARAMARRLERAQMTGALMGVIATRIADLAQIATAFGVPAAQALRDAWSTAVLAHAPISAILGDDGPDGLLIAIHPESASDARRVVAWLRRGIADSFVEADVGVVPIAELGLALTDTCGYDIRTLMDEARAAGRRGARDDAGLGDAGLDEAARA